MTLLVITPTYDGRDGLSCLARETVAALHLAYPDATVEVWSLTEPRARRHGGDAVVSCFGSRRSTLVAAGVSAACGVSPPAAVVVMHAHLLPVAAPMGVRGVPVVPVLVGIEAWKPFSWSQRWVYRRAARRVAISAHTIERFRETNPALATARVSVCRPPAPPLAVPASGRAPFGRFALVVGRMARSERYKGHDAVLSAWPSVVAAEPDARLVIAGDGDDRARLERRAAQLGLSGMVHFAGKVGDADLAALYRDAEVFVMPSRGEGFGFVFLEAMSSGCPCIGAPGSAEEIVEDGRTGLIVPGDDKAVLATAILRFWREPGLRSRMGDAGRLRARDAFSRARFARDLAQALGPLPWTAAVSLAW